VSQDKQLSSLEREIEETREHLATTIDQLLYRASPKTIVGREVTSIKAHFVDPATGQPRTDNILKAVGGVVGVIAFFVVVRKVVR
jgi:preprotein translocase subunit SecF